MTISIDDCIKLSEATKEMNTTKNTVYRHIRNLGIDIHKFDSTGIISFITITDYERLKDVILTNQTNYNTNDSDDTVEYDDDGLIEQLEERIKLYESVISEKNDTIDHLKRSNDNLMRLLENQQILSRQLSDNNSEVIDVEDQQDDDTQDDNIHNDSNDGSNHEVNDVSNYGSNDDSNYEVNDDSKNGVLKDNKNGVFNSFMSLFKS